MSMSAPWTRPGVHIVPHRRFPHAQYPEDRLVQKICASMNTKIPHKGALPQPSMVDVDRHRAEHTGIPCYPTKSPVRMVQVSRTQSWRAGPTFGVLRLRIKRAYGLMAADLVGTSDPYVVARCGGQRCKTRMLEKTLEPVWDEELALHGILDDFIKTGLELKIMDWDAIGSDDSIGEVKVKLHELNQKPAVEFHEKLSTQGQLEFSVSWQRASTGSRQHLAPAPQLSAPPQLLQHPWDSRPAPNQRPKSSLPAMPAILPTKFDWVKLAYQRSPDSLSCTEHELMKVLATSNTQPVLSASRSAPHLRSLIRPPSASAFERVAYEVHCRAMEPR